MPRVSICIPAYNEERNIGSLLGFLRTERISNGNLLEVLVEVSGSTDSTRDIVAEWSARWPLVRVLDGRERDGLLSALNRLIQTARGDVVVRVDADVRPGDGCLEQLLGALGAPDAGIASPRVVPEPSSSRLVDRASEAEWAVHHRVSLSEPKTTLVQAFRRLPIVLPSESGLEDAGLQQQVTALGYRAVYVPGATVSVVPPSTVRGMMFQRIRTVQHLHDHLVRGYQAPSTAKLSTVCSAVASSIRNRDTSLRALATFGVIELLARAAALASVLGIREPSFLWEP
ncbi:MAG TPA: glycosyltransferase, partial [Thermoplasmata archaeon]